MSLPSHPSERLHGFDALRGFALLLGVALHAAMSYLPAAEFFWIVADTKRSSILAGGFHWIHSFRMVLFFMLAGFFGRMALQRMGLKKFLLDRGKRILMPLVSLWFPVLAAILAVITWNAWLVNDGVLPEPPPQPPLSVHNFPLTHLWFLYVLSLLYVAMLISRVLFHAVDRRGSVQSLFDKVLTAIGGPAMALIAAIPTALALAMLPNWWHWFGIPTPDQSLIPNLTACVAYGSAFLGGWTLQRLPALLPVFARGWPIGLAIAVAASGFCFSQAGFTPPPAMAPDGVGKWLYAYAYAVAGWAWSFTFIGLSLRFLGGHSPVRRYLADASYWIYIVHLPLVMAAQVIASRFGAPWWIEYPLIVATVTGVAVLSYQLFIRHTRIGAWLNGKRIPQRDSAAVEKTQAAAAS